MKGTIVKIEIPKGTNTALAEPSSAEQMVGINKVAAAVCTASLSKESDFASLTLLNFESLKEKAAMVHSRNVTKVKEFIVCVTARVNNSFCKRRKKTSTKLRWPKIALTDCIIGMID